MATGGAAVRTTEAARQRRRVRTRIIVSVFFVFVGLIVLLESPLSRIRHVLVTGNVSIAAGLITAEANVRPGMSLWQVNGAVIQAAVQRQEPLVQAVHIRTDYLHGIVTLLIQEKHVVAAYESGAHFYHLLNDGTVYLPLSVTSGLPWPIVTAEETAAVQVGHVPANPYVSVVAQQLSEVSAARVANISELHVDRFGIVRLYLENGFEADCKASAMTSELSDIFGAVQYFSRQGYQPGLVDLTSGPPYRYTPFTVVPNKGGEHG